ncbi:MAG: hypothetical protein IAF38_16190 [Bacteroidia bacterium]|nr:hypothetical protein [Bacteroidia bacterium]
MRYLFCTFSFIALLISEVCSQNETDSMKIKKIQLTCTKIDLDTSYTNKTVREVDSLSYLTSLTGYFKNRKLIKIFCNYKSLRSWNKTTEFYLLNDTLICINENEKEPDTHGSAPFMRSCSFYFENENLIRSDSCCWTSFADGKKHYDLFDTNWEKKYMDVCNRYKKLLTAK